MTNRPPPLNEERKSRKLGLEWLDQGVKLEMREGGHERYDYLVHPWVDDLDVDVAVLANLAEASVTPVELDQWAYHRRQQHPPGGPAAARRGFVQQVCSKQRLA